MKKNKYIKKLNQEQVLLLIVVLLIFPVILFTTGTITSGWHFTDDHETVMLVEQRIESGVSFWQAFRRAYLIDINLRWRPVYWFFRVLGAYVFGANYVMHNLFLCVVGMITYLLLYGMSHNFGCDPAYAHLFAGIAVLGRQYEIWFRIANQENAGLFFLSICLWIISRQYKDNLFSRKKYDVLLLASAIICSLIKESFFLLLPGIVLFRLALEGITIKGRWKKWILLLIRRCLFWIPALLAFAWSAYMIVFYVGTAPIDYAGVDLDEGWQQTLWNIMRMRGESLEDFVDITILCTLFLFGGVALSVIKRRKISALYVLCGFLGVYVVIGQIVLYAKSGMWDRYLVPFVVGYGFIFIILAEKLLFNKYVRVVYGIILTLFLISRIYISIVGGAIPYAEEGRQIQAMLQYTVDETSEEADILICLGGRETNLAACMYLEADNRSRVYFCEDDDIMLWHNNTNSSVEEPEQIDWKILILDSGEDNTLLESKVITDDWKCRQFGNYYTVWMKGK